MTTAPSPAPPQLSPDGQWWWDGKQWIPAARAGAPPAAVAAPVTVDADDLLPGVWEPEPEPYDGPVDTADGKAVASLVLGLLWLVGFGSLAAVVLGHLSAGASRRQGLPPSGLATAGLALGYAGLVGAVVVTFVLAAAFG